MRHETTDELQLRALQEDVDRLASRARAMVVGPQCPALSRRGHAELMWALVELELAADHLEFAEAYRTADPLPAPASDRPRVSP